MFEDLNFWLNPTWIVSKHLLIKWGLPAKRHSDGVDTFMDFFGWDDTFHTLDRTEMIQLRPAQMITNDFKEFAWNKPVMKFRSDLPGSRSEKRSFELNRFSANRPQRLRKNALDPDLCVATKKWESSERARKFVMINHSARRIFLWTLKFEDTPTRLNREDERKAKIGQLSSRCLDAVSSRLRGLKCLKCLKCTKLIIGNHIYI